MAKLSSAELAKREDVIQKMKKNKRSLVKRYGPDAEKVMYGRATNIAKKVAESEMEKSNLKELVRAALMNEKAGFSKEYDDNPALKGGQKNLPDGLQKAIINKAKSANEDLDLGHQDNEPHMIKGELYRIGKYAMELYNMVDQFEGQGEVDFPAWWQSKITTAMNMVSSAKHYLEFELKEPEVDAMVDIAAAEDIIPNVPTEPLEDEIEENLDAKYTPSEDYKYVVKSKSVIGFKGREDKMYFRTEEAAKAYVADGKPGMRKYLGVEDEIEEGIHDRDITSAPHTNVKGEMGAYDPAKRAASLKRLANFGPKKNDDEIEEGLPKGFWDKKMKAKDEVDEASKEAYQIIIKKSELGNPDSVRDLYNRAWQEFVLRYAKQNNIKFNNLSDAEYTVKKALEIPSPDNRYNEDSARYLERKGILVIKEASVDESFEKLVGKLKKGGKSEKAAKAIAGAVASYKAKGGGKGPTAKQKARG